MKRKSTLKMVHSALFAALIFAGTQFIKIPLPIGYFNLGDPFVLLCGYLIGGTYGAAAAAVGSALADLLSGYVIYAPATLLIKCAMALIVFAACRITLKTSSTKKCISFIFAAIIAEAVMVLGYYFYDCVLYGFGGAFLSLPGNLLQAVTSVAVSTVIVVLIDKTKISKFIKQ